MPTIESATANLPDKQTDAARQFALEAAKLAANTRCRDVVVLDVTGLSPVCDFFVIATGTSARQMRTVIDDIAELGQKHNYVPLNQSGLEGDAWMLIDFVDVIVHVFSDTARAYYDLENLWGDAKRIEYEENRHEGT